MMLLLMLDSLWAGPGAYDFSVKSLNPQNLPVRWVLFFFLEAGSKCFLL